MTDLAANLERLGLEQYLDAFIGEGFDTWETLLDVQETDLEALNVKLGHRRKLQRAIADYRGISYERLVGSPAAQEGFNEPTRFPEGSQAAGASKENTAALPAETKRKYRRHPKADENAPEKPPSAYVLFSNKVREEVKADNLSFTEIAKLVGDRWQKLEPPQKEPYELQATSLKEQYNIQLSAYKKTESYKEYAQYLSEFKAKHGPQTEPKRPKLELHSSGGSVSATSADVPDIPITAGHGRVGSIGSMSTTSIPGTVVSQTGGTPGPLSMMANIPGMGPRGLPSLPRPPSPQLSQQGRDRRMISHISTHSSISDESVQGYDPLSRTATLSLSTPPTGTPPLPHHSLRSGRPDQNMAETYSWPLQVAPPVLQQQGSITPSGPAPMGSGITLPSPTFPNESWRERPMDWSRQIQSGLPASVGGQPPSLPLPPMLGHDRMAELSHGQSPRTLPPLRQNPSGHPSFSASSPTAHLSRQGSTDTERRFSQTIDNVRQLDRHENEAASALAGLAARPGQNAPQSRSHDRNRP